MTATGVPLLLPLPLLDEGLSSIQPLKTFPKPPSPSNVSDLKFLVAAFSSASVKLRQFGRGKMCPVLTFSGPPPLETDDWLIRDVLLKPKDDVIVVLVV